MKSKSVWLAVGLLALSLASSAHEPMIRGRWEFVHKSGDNLTQYNPNVTPATGYPGSFSGYLTDSGGGVKASTLDTVYCHEYLDNNVETSWVVLENGQIRVTFTASGNSTGDFQFIYTGTLTSHYVQTANDDSQVVVTAMYGSYTTTGDVSACNYGSGEFVATYFPDLAESRYDGDLASDPAIPHADQATVPASLNIVPLGPQGNGHFIGTVRLGPMTMRGAACFDPVSDSATLNLLPLSNQAGVVEIIYGADKNGAQLKMVTQSVNLTTNQSAPTGWPVEGAVAVAAAIGEDDVNGGISGIVNDGANKVLVAYYYILGGPCDGAGGTDSEFRLKMHGDSDRHHHKASKRRMEGESDRDDLDRPKSKRHHEN